MTATVQLRRFVEEACDGPFGSAIKSEHYSDYGARVIRLGNIGPAEWRGEDAAYLDLEYFGDLARHSVAPYDLLIAGLGDDRNPVGRAAVAPPDLGPALVKADCYRLRLRGAHPQYVAYCLSSSFGQAQSAQLADGSTRQRLTLGKALSLRIPDLPLSEQRAIADYLDVETARIDALIAKKQQLIHLLEERISSVILRGVSGQLTSAGVPVRDSGLDWLGPIPEHYGTPTIGANFSTQLGKMLNAETAAGPEQFPYIKNTNVKWDEFDLSGLPTMSFPAEDRARCELRAGDLLVCEGGEVGRSAVWPGSEESIYFQKALHRVRPLTNASTRFLMYCLWAAADLDVFSVEGNQATIVHLTGEKLREHRFPWPPAEEQAEIVRLIDIERARVAALVSRLSHQSDLLAEHRRAVVTAAVTGDSRCVEVTS